MAVKLDAMIGCFPAERVSISNRAGCVVHPEKVTRLQLGHVHSHLFRHKADRRADFRQMRRPAELAE